MLRSIPLVTLVLAACAGPTEAAQPRMIGAIESFFGECEGACQHTLVMEGGAVAILRAQTYGGADTLSEHRGTLTSAGLQRIAAIESSIPTLRTSYGCPDCADGGAMRLSLNRPEGASVHTWEFGQPPAELARVDRFFDDVSQALRACTEHVDVRPDRSCSPISR
ncbi:MAG: hypothetical protein KTR31_35200 [Myxococcales bacterium]|nr:hypothetical protein [Myxococcales bacterium]